MDEVIPRESWADFCERFTYQHRGWLVALNYRATSSDAVDLGARPTPEVLSAFRSLKLVDAIGGAQLCVADAEDSGHERLATVRRPARLVFERTADGSHSGLRLEGHGGEMLVLRFRTPTRPEVLDGLAAGSKSSAK